MDKTNKTNAPAGSAAPDEEESLDHKPTLDLESLDSPELVTLKDKSMAYLLEQAETAMTGSPDAAQKAMQERHTIPTEALTQSEGDKLAQPTLADVSPLPTAKAEQVKALTALLGADNLEEEDEADHTLSRPVKLDDILRHQHEEKRNKHIAASFQLSQTLEHLSVKEVEKETLEQVRKRSRSAPKKQATPPTTHQKTQEAQEAQEAQEESAPPPQESRLVEFSQRMPGWLLWLVAVVVWTGLALLTWKIMDEPSTAKAPLPDKRDAAPLVRPKAPSPTRPRATPAKQDAAPPPTPAPPQRRGADDDDSDDE